MAHKQNKARPVMRYHGGKWILGPWIIEHFPEHRIYVEPFGGAASVLLQKDRVFSEVYNDLDDGVVNVFRAVRDHGPELQFLLQHTPFARSEYLACYAEPGDSVERARQMMTRTFLGFGSDSSRRMNGFRKKSDKSGTSPAKDFRNLADALPFTTERMRGVVIENRDYAKILDHHDSPETLFYVDPPYVHSTRQSAKEYTFEMDDKQHRLLADRLHALKGKVLVSGYHSKLYDELYGDWRRDEIGAFADGARKRTEVVWMNYDATPGLFSYPQTPHVADAGGSLIMKKPKHK